MIARHGIAVWLLMAVGTVVAQVGAPPPPARQAERTRPNVLLILIDDLGLDKLGCYAIGDEATRPVTPNIDALAAGGLRFTNYYTNPICSPTRAQILTGRHGFRTGVQNAVRPFQDGPGLPLDEVTLPEILTPAGYAHAQIGKWHLGSLANGGPAHALLSGWDFTAGMEGNPGPREQDYTHWMIQVNGEVTWREGYLTRATTDDAITQLAGLPEPWHLWLAYNAGHGPWHVPPVDLHDRDPNAIAGDDVRMYQAMIEAVDHEIGRMLATLPPDVRRRTTVILAGDNGSPAEATVPPLVSTRAKGTLFEGGVHVPLIVSGFSVPPRHRGQVCDALASSVDLFSTVADLAGAAVPADRVVDGVSLRPLLQNPSAAVRTRAFAEIAEGARMGIPEHRVMLTDGRHKLIRFASQMGGPPLAVSFYDLEDAAPGRDGPDLCPCPENLDEDQARSYRRFNRELNELLDL